MYNIEKFFSIAWREKMLDESKFDWNRPGLITVSGCPRSGTSLMMDCLRMAFGDDRIIGGKFPQEDRIAAGLQKHEEETDSEYEARQYLRDIVNPHAARDFTISKDMNPNGFWECRYSVRGITWHMDMPKLDNQICKIVSQGLISSNPDYISKIIYMLRDPRQVAKSQERLKRFPFMTHEEEMNSGLVIHTPEMFIQVTYQACKWLIANPEVPVLTVSFDDLIMYPDEALNGVKEFLKEGDFSKHQIDPKLKRSYPQEVGNHLWEYADTMYEFMKKQEYQKVIDYFEENSKMIFRDKVTTFCTRLRERMVYNECKNCKNSCSLVKNLAKRAEERKIAWQYEPCMFDCLTNPFEDHISMRESIENNHWKIMTEQEQVEEIRQ
jgi:hypothetical protein